MEGRIINKTNRSFFVSLFAQKGLSETDMANRLGIKPDTLYKKLTGQRKISLNEIIVICTTLNMKFENIFMRRDENV
jgi:DNA-binding XRE family transcriptional regulator